MMKPHNRERWICRHVLLLWLAMLAMPATLPAQLPTVKLIATGGTIAMKLDPETNAPVPAISGDQLLATVPEIAGIARITVENFSNIPSDYMDPERWVQLHAAVVRSLADPGIVGVIISQGTDTLEETAYFLDLTVDSRKPVVLIGAQRNASERDFDGPRNLWNGVRTVLSAEAWGKGVLVVLNDQINAAREVRKSHTSDVGTFQSGEFGLLGRADADRIVFHRAPTRRQNITLQAGELPTVEIVAMYAGADGGLIRAAVENGAKGVVVQALGMGNLNIPMYAAIQKAIIAGVPVVISTRVPNGRVMPVYGFQGGGQTLQELGAVFAGDLSPQKARILLMLALQSTMDPVEIQKLFDR